VPDGRGAATGIGRGREAQLRKPPQTESKAHRETHDREGGESGRERAARERPAIERQRTETIQRGRERAGERASARVRGERAERVECSRGRRRDGRTAETRPLRPIGPDALPYRPAGGDRSQ
jgi:hypothetical protein